MEADLLFGECDFAHCRMMILPGGYEGTMNMMNHREFLMRLKEYAESGGFVAAICTAPMVLARASVLGGHEATIYDGMESELLDASYVKRDVVCMVSINCLLNKFDKSIFRDRKTNLLMRYYKLKHLIDILLIYQ